MVQKVFSRDITKQLAEYQVEYYVLQEEISNTQHYVDNLNKEKELSTQLATKLKVISIKQTKCGFLLLILLCFEIVQFSESSIAQLEKTRSLQQTEIQTLQTQVQSLQTTVDTLGQFILQLFDQNENIDIPDDVRRIVQQIGNLEYQRKKPLFVERKIGKSMSMNGFPLKVLEELNENVDNNLSSKSVQLGKTKSQFFENTYMQLRKQNRMRPMQLDSQIPENNTESITTTVEIHPPVEMDVITKDATRMLNGTKGNKIVSPSVESVKSIDSGIATPITPKDNVIFGSVPTDKECARTTITTTTVTAIPNGQNNTDILHHPFGNCEDVNFKFNGTTQLKSLRPIHLRSFAPAAGEKHIDSRS